MTRFANPFNPLLRAAVVIGSLLASMAAVAQTTLASSDFSQSNEDWNIFGLTDQASYVPQLVGPLGPGPGGFIALLPGRTQIGFAAPAKFLGDKSAAVGGQLSFRFLRESETEQTILDGLVTLVGAGVSLRSDFNSNLGSTTWFTKVVQLDESGLFDVGTNQPATLEQIRTVLADLDILRIDGPMFQATTMPVFLDDVQLLSAVPEPATWALLTAGILVLGASAAHRRTA